MNSREVLHLLTILSATALIAQPVKADVVQGFQYEYAPFRWTLTNEGVGGGNGYVDTQYAPETITLGGSNLFNDESTMTSYTIPIAGDGVVNFSWDYSTNDKTPEYDPFGYILDGVTTQLSDDNGNNTQTGDVSLPVKKDSIFGWYVYTKDNQIGRAHV